MKVAGQFVLQIATKLQNEVTFGDILILGPARCLLVSGDDEHLERTVCVLCSNDVRGNLLGKKYTRQCTICRVKQVWCKVLERKKPDRGDEDQTERVDIPDTHY